MSRKGFYLILLCFNFTIMFGQNPSVKPVLKPSVINSTYIMHTVKQAENLYRISKIYGVSVNEILKVNASLTENNLKLNQILRIPNKGNKIILINSETTANELQPKVTPKSELILKNGKYHTVETGQTMYAISKIYAIKVEDIQKWNGLKDFYVKVGSQILIADPNLKENIIITNESATKKTESQKLFTQSEISKPKKLEELPKDEKPIKTAEPQIFTETETEKPDIQASDNATQKDLAKIYKEKIASSTAQSSKGTGAPMKTTLGEMETVYFAMHKWLPIGTIIKIKNLVNSKVIYAKVIGKLPDIDENKNVIIRYSLGVKKDLQLQNGKCYIQLEYAN